MSIGPLSRLRGALLIVGVVVVLTATVAVVTHVRTVAKADGREDAQVKVGLETIRTTIFAYANAHDHNLPQSDQVTAAGLSDYLRAGASWPVNPFTDKPMLAGTGPGEFQFRRLSDHAYTIDSVGTDGKSVW
jgi:hypothetical protein